VVAIAIGVALTSGCGTSTASRTTIPATAGLGLDHTVTRLCDAGLRVTLSEIVAAPVRRLPAPVAPSLWGLVRTDRAVIATGTLPSAGTLVPKGALVMLTLRSAAGVEEAVKLPASCRA